MNIYLLSTSFVVGIILGSRNVKANKKCPESNEAVLTWSWKQTIKIESLKMGYFSLNE